MFIRGIFLRLLLAPITAENPMRLSPRVLLLLLLSLVLARHSALAQAVASDSSAVVGARGVFRARIPGPAVMVNDSSVSRAGVVRRTRWTSTMDHPTYRVELIQYPPGTVSRFPPAQVLREEAASLARVVGGTLQPPHEVTLSSHPGLEFTITRPGVEVHGRIFLAGNRLYLVYVLFAPAVGAPGLEAFLASLELLPR
jgi:hypothetical protein